MDKVLEFYVKTSDVLNDDLIKEIEEYNNQVSCLKKIGDSIKLKATKYAQEKLTIPKIIYAKYSPYPSVKLLGGELEKFKDMLSVKIENMSKEAKEKKENTKTSDTMAGKLQKAGIDPMKILNSGALTKDQKQKIISEILEG